MASVEKRIQEEILRDLDMTREISDEELLGIIRQKICDVGKGEYLSIAYRMELEHRIFYGLRRLDVLEDLLADDTITEIMVNGPDQIFIERNGCLEETKYHFSSNEKLDDVIQRIASANNKMANTSHPIVDTRLADGSRVNMVLAPIAVDHSVLSIRKFPKEQITMEKLIAWQALSQEAADFICQLVQSGYNIFVSGGTGSGKTTFLNAMSEFIPKDQRVITIEDSAELQMSSVPNLVRLETRGANAEGEGAVEISDLIRASLRMRPNYLIVGEVRGKECLDMLQALNTGHFGLSTGHGNSARDMLSRLETMTLMAADIPLTAVRGQIASAIDILVHLGRLRDRSRRVLEITEVTGYAEGEIQLNPLYRFEERGDADEDRSPGGAKQGVRGSLTAVGTLARQEKLHAAGYSL